MTKKYPIEIYFRFYNCEDSEIQLLHEGKVCEPKNTFYIHKTELELPGNLRFEMRGKHKKRWDTQIDKNGNMLFDRYIKIVKVTVNHLMPNQLFLRKWPNVHPNSNLANFTPSNQQIHTNYIGFNGVIDLDFEGETPAKWLIKSQKYMDKGWQDDSDLHDALFVA
jgi:hypothetical protein